MPILTQIIKNFIYLSQTEYEIFPYQLEIDAEANKVSDISIAIAMRLMTHFERRGFNMDLFNVFYPKLNEEHGGDFPTAFLEVLIARQRFQTIIDGKAIFYISTL